MTLPWPDPRCILCLGADAPLTKAHVIPQAIGGRLAARFLCARCNSTLGGKVEAGLKRDPQVRLAIEALKSVPAIMKMRDGQLFVGRARTLHVRAKARGGTYQLLPSPQQDGSLVVDADDARDQIAKTLSRRGATEKQINEAIGAHDAPAEGQRVDVAPGFAIRKGSFAGFDPSLSSPLVPDLCAVSIAYLWAALAVGKAIYGPALDPVRRALRGGDAAASFGVEPLRAACDYEPWHGLVVQRSKPNLVAQIRLFGQIAWLVHFAQVALVADASSIPGYRLDLADCSDHWSMHSGGPPGP